MGVDVVAYAKKARKWCDLNRFSNLNLYQVDKALYDCFHPRYPYRAESFGLDSAMAELVVDEGIAGHKRDYDAARLDIGKGSEEMMYRYYNTYWCLLLKRFCQQHADDTIFVLDDQSNDDYSGRQSRFSRERDTGWFEYYKGCGIPEDEIFAYDVWKPTGLDKDWIDAELKRLYPEAHSLHEERYPTG